MSKATATRKEQYPNISLHFILPGDIKESLMTMFCFFRNVGNQEGIKIWIVNNESFPGRHGAGGRENKKT